MDAVATVESLWRYPVKSMRGEQLQQASARLSGIYGDRIYAIHDASAPDNFPYLTGRQRAEMLLYQPRFRDTHRALAPHPPTHEEAPAPGLPDTEPSLMVDVDIPGGPSFSIDDPGLLDLLRTGLDDRHQLSLLRSSSAITDAFPVSLFSIQTARRLGQDLGAAIDKRRFRANIYLDLASDTGFGEDDFVGRHLGIGPQVVLWIEERDPRCKMITLDPDTAQANPEVMKQVARAYDSCAGVYARVVHPGTLHAGDGVRLLD